MIQVQSDSKPKILTYLKRLAPYSIVDLGIQYAEEGHVVECSRAANKISGIVNDRKDEQFSTSINILSGSSVEALCTCSSKEEMEEQWCPHAIAMLWRASELDFFDLNSGFAASEAAFRMNTTSPREIASVINGLLSDDENTSKSTEYLPNVKIEITPGMDRLGIRIYFDESLQEPTLFEGFAAKSKRALDNLLLQVLEDEASWDDEAKIWYVNASSEIETVLGLIQEYPDVVLAYNLQKVVFAEESLNALLSIKWLENGAELLMHWVLPDSSTILKETELLGTGPYWTIIEGTIYRLSITASRIASIFPHSSALTLTRSQVGPVLEAIKSIKNSSEFIDICNPELQPLSKIKSPKPVLELNRRGTASEHFTSQSQLEIFGTLEFSYPSPPTNKNLVYLPDREKEKEYSNFLTSLGFEYQQEKKRFSISDDAALDLIHHNFERFDKSWQVNGLNTIKKTLRFTNLSIDLSISANSKSEKTKAKTDKIDWFDCHLSLIQNNANVPISSLFKNIKATSDKWIRLDSGSYAKVPGGGLKQLKNTLGLLSPNYRLANTIKTKIGTAQAICLSNISDEQFTLSLDKKLKVLANKLRNFENIESYKASKSFVGQLRSYQEEGLSWLHFLHSYELGGILADEMGLGKTIQTLALLQNLKDQHKKKAGPKKPALVVAPTSVVTNWLYEAQRFTPKLKVLLLQGPQRKQHFAELANYDLILTSYALLRIDRYELENTDFAYVILDEAQNIKNPLAATTKAAKSLRAERRLVLTGTPTENRPLELWSIFDFLMPGYLGSASFFKSNIEKPILEGGPGVDIANFLNSKTHPFILRRLKEDVEKDLPKKLESEIHVQMTPSQQQLYAQILDEVRPKVFEAVSQKGVRGASISILAALLRLRQVCNHPNSIEALTNVGGYESGKFNVLMDIIHEALSTGRKILVFSQFREMLAIIRRWLNENSVNYLYLDGATKERHKLIERFNSDENVRLFLISLKAGGTGLNLTAADTVVIYDPWWNPAVESQAIDRAHRIGQTKNVSVYRLITDNSIEQKIMDLKAKKEKIVEALIHENSLSPLKLTKKELENLFEPFPGPQS